MRSVWLLFDVVLAAYVAWEVVRFIPQYRRLKEAVADGDSGARTRIYFRALRFEWASAVLALVALRCDWTQLNPRWLGLYDAPIMQMMAGRPGFSHGALAGILAGVALGTVALLGTRLIGNRRTAAGMRNRQPTAWHRILPDFSALLPVTRRERTIWIAVAVSAGICEEIVFRGWLLATLHHIAGLHGTALIVLAAAIFGLAHVYQRITGVILTTFAGLLFCVLYIKTGSLFAPMLLHVLVDVRFGILPPVRTELSNAVTAL